MRSPPGSPASDADASALSAPAEAGAGRQVGRPGAVVSISSDALFDGAAEVQIAHRGVVYRLKQTALGKLILTK